MSSYSSFRKTNNDINNLRDKFNKLSGKRSFDDLDETYWTTKHVANADGVGEAIVRFLPAPPDGNGGQEPDDIVKYFQFSIFKDGKAYINRGRNSLGHDEKDPAHEYNTKIWQRKDISTEEKKKILVDRSEYYIANILVIKDPNKPENEGKVFRWKFGRMIYNLINGQLFPEFETDTPVNVFDPIEGANFNFRVTQTQIRDNRTGQMKTIPTYKNSKFSNPSAICSLDEFDDIWKKCHSLQSEIAPDKFRSYEDLKAQFDRVMGSNENKNFLDSDDPIEPQKKQTAVKSKNPVEQKNQTTEEQIDDEVPWFTDEEDEGITSQTSNTTDDSDADDWFSKLA